LNTTKSFIQPIGKKTITMLVGKEPNLKTPTTGIFYFPHTRKTFIFAFGTDVKKQTI